MVLADRSDSSVKNALSKLIKGDGYAEIGTQDDSPCCPARQQGRGYSSGWPFAGGGGYIEPEYVQSMLGREQEANTYLGNGIAIPHGMLQDKDKIRQTGIAVVQVPQAVQWNPGEPVYLVIGIAARSDEHIEVLANLTDVLGDAATVQRLATTNDAGEIIARLTQGGDGQAAAVPAAVAVAAPVMQGETMGNRIMVTIQGGAGLHARPATHFVNVAKQFQSDIQVRYRGKTANGKSLVSLLRLGAAQGATIEIGAQGPDEAAAVRALQEAVAQGLGEGAEEATPAEQALPAATVAWTPAATTRAVPGIAASPGLAIGPIRQLKRSMIRVEETARDPDAEERHLKQAIAAATVQLDDLYKEVKARSGAGKAAIFRAHAEFLDDPDLVDEARGHIRAGRSAGWAWQQAIAARVDEMQKLDDPLLANRAVDLSDVGQRVLRLLGGVVESDTSLPDTPVIIMAEDLTPSDTAGLDPRRVLGFCTAGGGPTSHSAIIARSLGIPSIVGAGPAALKLANGTMAILDGNVGNVYVEPSEADLAAARQVQAQLESLRDAEQQARYEPAMMTDGYRVEVVANINRAAEAEQAVNAGAEGVGLLRTEFLFLERPAPPSEDEQFAAYSEMVRALNGLPLIIRTLDIGGDKNAPYLNLPAEDNSFMGVRGIRLCLARPELFRPQLRAIFRAAALGPVRIMYPMIATLEDLRAAKQMTEEVRQDLNAAPVEIGMMIEVPSSVIMADVFAREVDFFSIGTNDLTQYTLAMDRLHPMLAKQADGLHPAVLRMIERTVQAARAEGKWVGVCGGIAGEPKGALILAGLGVTELSVAIPSIAAVKAQMRGVSLARVQAVAQQALACATAEEVRSLRYP